MAKQLLIYEQVEHVNSKRHKDLSVKLGEHYEFARTINSIPLIAAEFPSAAAEYPIVFAGTPDGVIPAVILGLREDENFYINDKGAWTAKYIPAFLHRYPFIFSSTDDGKTFTLCIDEGFSGCNREGRGERLFDADGEQTQYLKGVLEFLKGYQAHYQRTEAFCRKLIELELLEPMSAQFTTPRGERVNLTGFMAINREKLKGLGGDQLKALAATDELELIYVHIQSMRNFNLMLERATGTATPVGTVHEDIAETATEKEPKKKTTSRKTTTPKRTDIN